MAGVVVELPLVGCYWCSALLEYCEAKTSNFKPFNSVFSTMQKILHKILKYTLEVLDRTVIFKNRDKGI